MHIEKELILQGLKSVWSHWIEFGSELTEEDWETPSRLPGWSVKDNLAHLVSGEYMLSGRSLPKSEVSAEHIKNPIGEANEQALYSFRDKTGLEVLEAFKEITSERLEKLAVMSDKEFQAIGWTPAGEAPYGRFLQIRVYDAWLHLQDCREPLGLPGNEGGIAAEIAITEVSSAIGYIVGKKGKAPEGSCIEICITGPVERTFRVVVKDGRASQVESFECEVTSSISLSSLDFATLTGGRNEAGEFLLDKRVILGGDLEIARQIAENLAYTI